MERYRRAYRDANSPLTPLAPLSASVFDFNIDSESSCSRSDLFEGVRESEIPRARRRVNSPAACSWSTTPKSCDSALKQRNNNYIRVVAKLGGERTPTATSTARATQQAPPSRLGRSIKHEIPEIRLQPPPRSKRCRSQQEWENVQPKREYGDRGEDIENTQCLGPRSSFDPKRIRVSSPVQPKPMSPRFGEFLTRWGINCLKNIFERQEIDLQTFCCLTADDLELLGIQDPVNRERAIQAINFACGIHSGYRLGN